MEDNGLDMVIMDREDYIDKAPSLLTDTNTYKDHHQVPYFQTQK